MRAVVLQAGAVITLLWLSTGLLKAGSTTNTNTNVAAQIRLSPEMLKLLNRPQNGDLSFREQLEGELQIRGGKSAWDQVGLPRKIRLLHFVEERGYDIHDEMNSRGKEIFRRTAVYALRETATSRIPWDSWMATTNRFKRFLIDLMEGTLGNTDEEFINPEDIVPEPVNGLDPSWSFAETNAAPFRSWLKRAGQSSSSDFGVRPWRTDPYVYLKVRLFHRKVTSDTRLRLHSNAEDSDTLIRLQEQIRITLSEKWSLIFGASLFPIDTRNANWDYVLSARLQKALRRDRIFWYVGTSSRRDDGEGSKRTETAFLFLW